MKKIVMSKILRKFVILAFLTMGIIFVSSDSLFVQPVVEGAQCCELCLPDYNTCMSACGSNTICQQNCSNRLYNCNRHCNPCDEGGGPACLNSLDCVAIGYTYCDFSGGGPTGICQ